MNTMELDELLKNINEGNISVEDREELLKQFTRIIREVNSISKEFIKR